MSSTKQHALNKGTEADDRYALADLGIGIATCVCMTSYVELCKMNVMKIMHMHAVQFNCPICAHQALPLSNRHNVHVHTPDRVEADGGVDIYQSSSGAIFQQF